MSDQGASGKPAAKQGDMIVATDTHVVMIPSPGGPVPTPTPMPFAGALSDALSGDVFVENMAAAVQGSTASNTPSHEPAGGPFQTPPSNKATVRGGSSTVFVNDKPVAQVGGAAMTCNDPTDAPNGSIVGTSTVLVG
jgi:uncharacterized Zn-binding protein involved in type VI secretion